MRIALGARPADVLRLVLGQALAITLASAVAGLAAYLPARQAAHVDPISALRYE